MESENFLIGIYMENQLSLWNMNFPIEENQIYDIENQICKTFHKENLIFSTGNKKSYIGTRLTMSWCCKLKL